MDDKSMVGILLITHAPLGQAFIAALTHIFRAPPEQFEAIDVIADQRPDSVHAQAVAAVARLDTGAGVLVVTDIAGGTPSNCAGKLRALGQVEVIAGASLPMLLRALTYRHDTLTKVTEVAISGGQNGTTPVDPRGKLSS